MAMPAAACSRNQPQISTFSLRSDSGTPPDALRQRYRYRNAYGDVDDRDIIRTVARSTTVGSVFFQTKLTHHDFDMMEDAAAPGRKAD